MESLQTYVKKLSYCHMKVYDKALALIEIFSAMVKSIDRASCFVETEAANNPTCLLLR